MSLDSHVEGILRTIRMKDRFRLVEKGYNHEILFPPEILRPGVVMIQHSGTDTILLELALSRNRSAEEVQNLIRHLKIHSCDMQDYGVLQAGIEMAFGLGMPVIYTKHIRWPDPNRKIGDDELFRAGYVHRNGNTFNLGLDLGDKERDVKELMLQDNYHTFHDAKERLLRYMHQRFGGRPIIIVDTHSLNHKYREDCRDGHAYLFYNEDGANDRIINKDFVEGAAESLRCRLFGKENYGVGVNIPEGINFTFKNKSPDKELSQRPREDLIVIEFNDLYFMEHEYLGQEGFKAIDQNGYPCINLNACAKMGRDMSGVLAPRIEIVTGQDLDVKYVPSSPKREHKQEIKELLVA